MLMFLDLKICFYLTHSVSDHKSDVWSFGVLLFQIFTWGSQPFGPCLLPQDGHNCRTVEMSAGRILFKVVHLKYNVLQHPEPCSSNLNGAVKEIIGKCLEQNSVLRPSFRELKVILGDPMVKRTILAGEMRSISDRSIQGPKACDIPSNVQSEYAVPIMVLCSTEFLAARKQPRKRKKT